MDTANAVTEGVSYDTIAYTYDTRGNILKKTYSLDGTTVDTVSYGYTDTAWKDRLTVYDNVGLNFERLSTPTIWYTGVTMTWQHGGSTAVSYVYNADGIRTSKTVNGVTSNYRMVDSTLRRMTVGGNTLVFFDSSVLFNGTEYWYVHNAQGDVVGLIDAWGNYVVEYTYASWGKPLTKTGTLDTTLSTLNPFLYRGYIYDEEKGWYYCQSRYYDPTVGRWLKADGYLATGGNVYQA